MQTRLCKEKTTTDNGTTVDQVSPSVEVDEENAYRELYKGVTIVGIDLGTKTQNYENSRSNP